MPAKLTAAAALPHLFAICSTCRLLARMKYLLEKSMYSSLAMMIAMNAQCIKPMMPSVSIAKHCSNLSATGSNTLPMSDTILK